MLYSYSLTIPPNTPQDNPIELEMPLTPGIISGVDIRFPPGCAGLARCVIKYHEGVIFPSSAESYFAADTYPIQWVENLQFNVIPAVLTLVGWNIDNLYEHTITCHIAITEANSSVEALARRLLFVGQG